MKTIEQLLELSKNPYYIFTDAEKTVLNDFLVKKQVKDSKNSQNPNLTNSEDGMRVRVRNLVLKTIPDTKDAPEL